MNPTVFISHSCKDHEEAPPANLSAQEIQDRADRLAFARLIRSEIQAGLEAVDGLDVFLDVRGGLAAGDVWQDGLHQALRSCSGAVVLLSPESLQSGWVLKEATILSWRVFLGEPIRVVPVVLGVSDTQIREKGFGAVNLDAIQWVKVRDATEAERNRAVDEVVEALTPVAQTGLRSDQTEWKSTAERWVIELADQLRATVPAGREQGYLTQMYRALSIEPQDRDRAGDDPFRDIAVSLLTADTSAVLRVLNEVAPTNRLEREELQTRVRSLWVDAAAANKLPHVAGQSRVIALDGEEVESARDYVARAYCTRIRADRVLAPNDTSDGTKEQAITMVEDRLNDYLPIDVRSELEADVAENGPVFVILGPGLTRADVLKTLTEKYDPLLTFIVLAGPDPRTRLKEWHDQVLLLRPGLQPRVETAGRRYRNSLEAFVDGQT